MGVTEKELEQALAISPARARRLAANPGRLTCSQIQALADHRGVSPVSLLSRLIDGLRAA